MKRIGFWLNHCQHSYGRAIAEGAQKAAAKMNCDIDFIIGQTYGNNSIDRNFYYGDYPDIPFDRIDGLVFSSVIFSYMPQEKFQVFHKRMNLPLVIAGNAGKQMPSIKVNNEPGFRNLIRHLLLDHGYRRFAFVHGPQTCPDALMRFKILSETLKEYNLEVETRNQFFGLYLEYSGKVAADYFLDRITDLDVIVCSNDFQAIGMMDNLLSHGIKVPDDIAVTGFDDLLEASKPVYSLSTVKQDIHRIGYSSVQMLMRMISKEKELRSSSNNTRFIQRKSCGCSSFNGNHDNIRRRSDTWQTNIEKSKSRTQLFWFINNLSFIENIDVLAQFMADYSPIVGIADYEIVIRDKTHIFQNVIPESKPQEYRNIKSDVIKTSVIIPFFVNGINYIIKFMLIVSDSNGFNGEMLNNCEEIATALCQKIVSIHEKEQSVFTKSQKTPDMETLKKYEEKLHSLMNHKKRYLQPDITITDVAKELGMTRNRLSFLLNQYLKTSFSDFINSYRIEKAKEHLVSYKDKNKTINEIKSISGFESKATFYRAFKKITGVSPTEYCDYIDN